LRSNQTQQSGQKSHKHFSMNSNSVYYECK
jgi:hypothetical protein